MTSLSNYLKVKAVQSTKGNINSLKKDSGKLVAVKVSNPIDF